MSQSKRLLNLLSDHRWHSTPEIQEVVYGRNHLGVARIAARVADLKSDGHIIEGKRNPENPVIYLYRLVEKEPAQLTLMN